MFTAREALTLAQNRADIVRSMTNIVAVIKKAAMLGEYQVDYRFPDVDDDIAVAVIDWLVDLGYSVYMPARPDITIYWEHPG